jgi:hypothetical protein
VTASQGRDRVTLVSPHGLDAVKDILAREVDPAPSLLRCVLTLDAHYFRGTASVCGTVGEAEFRLLNRRGPGFSLRATGRLIPTATGSEIVVSFARPWFPDVLATLLPDRYRDDRETILGFLRTHLKATVTEESQQGAPAS